MKEPLFVVCLLAGLALNGSVHSSERTVACPKLCKCGIRPWFSPSSLYMEAPTVDCNDLGLLSLPETLPSDTQVLLLQSNSIAKIDKPLNYLVNLTEVDLSQNNITTLSDIYVGHLPQLVSLHLEENWISNLHDNCFAHLPNLQELYVNHNLLSLISPGAFHGLSNLLRLHLNSNQLKEIRQEWFHALSQLEILMIGENPIAQIQDMNFQPLSNLRSLVLARMNLTEIPDNALVGLNKLESISFYDNKFAIVPQVALRKVQSLKFLDLNKNPIERIRRGDFVDMIHMKELGINSMPELVSIDGFAVTNLPELTKIEATNNPRLSYIHPNAFYKLPRLETLMLNSNALSALHHVTVESLPSLREVSLHSNPIYCDCVVRWINMNKTKIRFMEPEALLCTGPPEFEGHHVRHVHFREMMDTCLPVISPESLPEHISVTSGRSVSFHCRAFAEPEPEIYWVTPSGEKILPRMASSKYFMHPEGTFDIYDISEKEAGQYTCVAHNLIGADMRSVSVAVNGYYPEPSNTSLHVQIDVIRPHSLKISWVPPKSSFVSNIMWSTSSVSNRHSLRFTARVPSDVKVFNLTHLHPLTQYEVCVEITDLQKGHLKNCINVSTTEQAVSGCKSDKSGAVMVNAIGLLLIVSAVTCSLIYMSVKSDHMYRKLSDQPPIETPHGPNSCPSPSLTQLCRSEVNATAIDLNTTN
ncbi:LOW QUALITY PROTEIN: leucine-rich repeat neuronal protein 3 [Colossoma macropomum]|uniref:LOW QUALITY PROTEIN: leucine-rich repeat neuronal protein 3 n=1 Tax=Colossoma macropomum TaxID=42526 RepID=UPI0018647F01|nr:LOW QUALITY PROTEIN: leucine-rich repeat neuronal protein 3 [Colossoma macropomum]